jgi:hypothetical protein
MSRTKQMDLSSMVQGMPIRKFSNFQTLRFNYAASDRMKGCARVVQFGSRNRTGYLSSLKFR